MQKVNLNDVRDEERKSPRGKYHKFVKNISIALGRDPDSFDLLKRHPFDLALTRIPPGKSYCPYHVESAQFELYLVLSGHGRVRDEKNDWHEVAAGDAFYFAPGEAHQLSNESSEDFVYYVIADNPMNDSCYYPDSKKWMIYTPPKGMIVVKGSEGDYYEGEE